MDDIRQEGNNIIWQTNQDSRKVWEIDPISGVDVVEYREEHYRKYRGRWSWISSQSTTWDNAAFTGYTWGTMTECPPVPELTALGDLR